MVGTPNYLNEQNKNVIFSAVCRQQGISVNSMKGIVQNWFKNSSDRGVGARKARCERTKGKDVVIAISVSYCPAPYIY